MALDISGEWLLGLEGPLPFPEAGLSRPSQRRNPPFQEAASESSPAYRAAVDPAAEWKQRALAAEKKLKAIEALLNS